MSQTGQIVQKLWNYCHVLRDDGLSYLDCIEQLNTARVLEDPHIPNWIAAHGRKS